MLVAIITDTHFRCEKRQQDNSGQSVPDAGQALLSGPQEIGCH